MPNQFTGLVAGPPLGDARLDLCDLYVFPSPATPDNTVFVLTANPEGGPLHPDAVYRLNIDNSGDLRSDIAFSFTFSEPRDGRQTVDVYLAAGSDAEEPQAVGSKLISGLEVSFGDAPEIARSGSFTIFVGARSEAMFIDYDGIAALYDSPDPWSGQDSNVASNVIAMVVEVPTAALAADPDLRVWGRCSVRRDGTLVHADRLGHPLVSAFFPTADTKAEYDAGEPIRDRERWIGLFVNRMMELGRYTREDAIAALDNEGVLPDMLTVNPSRPVRYPNGRTLTDDVVRYRLAAITNGVAPAPVLEPHADLLDEFPYLGPPHATTA